MIFIMIKNKHSKKMWNSNQAEIYIKKMLVTKFSVLN